MNSYKLFILYLNFPAYVLKIIHKLQSNSKSEKYTAKSDIYTCITKRIIIFFLSARYNHAILTYSSFIQLFCTFYFYNFEIYKYAHGKI